jgi:hypothetical protein
MTPIGTLFTLALVAAAPMVPAPGAATLSVNCGNGEIRQQQIGHDDG